MSKRALEREGEGNLHHDEKALQKKARGGTLRELGCVGDFCFPANHKPSVCSHLFVHLAVCRFHFV
jgi:hypothetical protein